MQTSIAFIFSESSAVLPYTGILGFGVYEKTWVLVTSLLKQEVVNAHTLVFTSHLIGQITVYLTTIVTVLTYLIKKSVKF